MARFIEPITDFGPDSALKVWRKVEECRDALNALMNMTGEIRGKIHATGRLDVQAGSSVFKFEEPTETGSAGA